MASLPKYDLKPRGTYKGQGPLKNDENKKGPDKLVNRMIICALILTAVVFLKMSGAPFAGGVIDKIAYFLNAQTDFVAMAEDVGGFVNGFVAKMMGDDNTTLPADNKAYGFVFPVKEGNISAEVFNAQTSPSVSINTGAGALVYACGEGVVDNIVQNENGTKRVTLKINDMLVAVYDNIGTVYISQGDFLEKSTLIGSLPETSAELVFTVWLNGAAADPSSFFESPSPAQ